MAESGTRQGSRIVLVEDDESIGRAMHDALAGHGYRVDWCRDAATATAAIEQATPGLVLLDAGLPDIDGFTLCRWLREQDRDLPIVLVTARDADIDIVVGLDAGANDYVTKPFSMSVLLARVRSQLRRADAIDPMASIKIGKVQIDPASYVVTVDGEPVTLRRREFELLLVLAREVDRVVTRERLMSEVWDVHWDGSTKTLDMHIMALRRNLGDAIAIATVRGVGYRMVAW